MSSVSALLPWMTLGVILWLVAVAAAYWAVMRISPVWSLGVVFGAKLLKLIIIACAFVAVRNLTEIPLMPFACCVLGIVVVTIVFETFIFLYLKKKNNENKQ